MIIIIVVLLAFVIPVLIVVWREWKHKKDEEAKEGVKAAEVKEPVRAGSVIKAAIVFLLVAVPAYFLSSAPYRYFPADESALKVGFKHSGKRIVDCDEKELLKRAGERYRQALKTEGRVKMDIQEISGCPRERYPVMVELEVDGHVILDKAYAPTGIKKDMASYIYDEFKVKPGVHTVSVKMYDREKSGPPEYTMTSTVEFKPQEIKVIWFDDKANTLVIE